MELSKMLYARGYAADISEKLISAYWADSHREYLISLAHEDFLKLAEAMGYTVEKKP